MSDEVKDVAGMIETKLIGLKKRLPSHLIKELGDTMKSMPLSEKQCDAIINKTVAEFERRKNGGMKDINERIAGIESSIIKIADMIANGKSKTEAPLFDKPNDLDPLLASISKPQEMYGTVQKQKPGPRLVKINEDTKSVMVLLKWIEFLIEKVGRENLLHTLEFYVDIGWVNDEILSQLMTYAKGINMLQQDSNGTYTSELNAKDHIQSLLFIEKLRGNEVDRQMISMLEREVASIKKGSEEIYGI